MANKSSNIKLTSSENWRHRFNFLWDEAVTSAIITLMMTDAKSVFFFLKRIDWTHQKKLTTLEVMNSYADTLQIARNFNSCLETAYRFVVVIEPRPHTNMQIVRIAENTFLRFLSRGLSFVSIFVWFNIFLLFVYSTRQWPPFNFRHKLVFRARDQTQKKGIPNGIDSVFL